MKLLLQGKGTEKEDDFASDSYSNIPSKKNGALTWFVQRDSPVGWVGPPHTLRWPSADYSQLSLAAAAAVAVGRCCCCWLSSGSAGLNTTKRQLK